MGDIDLNWERIKLEHPAVSEEEIEELKTKIEKTSTKSTVPICRRKIYGDGSSDNTLLVVLVGISLLILTILAVHLGFKLKRCK
jgi:hypothetical protein